MIKYIGLIFIFFPVIVFSQSYNILLIPDSLLKNANAVVRFQETRIVIHSINSATVRKKYAYTILNEKGDHFAGYQNYYDDFKKISEVTGKLYDSFGQKIRSVKKKEMEDMAYDDHFSLITDARIKKYNFYCKQYPYTVEYEEEIEYKGIYCFNSWEPISDNDLSIQKSIFSVEMPTDYQLRYKLINGAKAPELGTENNAKTLSWELNNFAAIPYESLQPELYTIVPDVLIGPVDFEYGGYKGNMNTWKGFGEFYEMLYKGRDGLPNDTKIQIHNLIDGVPDREQKIKLLYEFMQKNTHYIGIQLGIGGLQPFEASYVAEKKYGDCKALSNYMVSLIKEAGIKAYNAVIYGGREQNEFYEDFPNHYFNHVVTCVPNGKDSIWLECTSQSESAGYSGSFTGGRNALLITDEGGKIVSTPIYSAADNLQIRNVQATIDENGTLSANIITHYTGIQQEEPNSLLNNSTPEERQKFLNNELNLPTYKVDKIAYKEIKGKIPAMDEYLSITAENYANLTGKRLFVVPNLFNKVKKLPIVEKRKLPVELKSAYKDVDSISIKIPTGYIAEAIPKDKLIENKFGTYRIRYKISNDIIELVREREQNIANFPAKDYDMIAAYFASMYKADMAQIVLVKKD